MVRARHAVLFLLCWAGWVPEASAWMLPSFYLDECGWHATHVVVVTEGKKIDGVFEVLDSWRGDLRKGHSLKFPELAVFADVDKRAIFRPFGKPVAGELSHVSGSRMILFLKWKSKGADPSKGAWEGADGGDLKTSISWIESGETYAFRQFGNPGPQRVIPEDMTEEKMWQRVRHLARVKANLERATAIADPADRAAALCPFVGLELEAARQAALQSLGKCGRPALPAFRKLLADSSLSPRHASVVKTLAGVSGEEVERELALIVSRELAFWREKGPKLKERWWYADGLQPAEAKHLRDRYSLVLEAVRGLGKSQYIEGRSVVRELRDFWASLPQLGVGQITDECDEVLAALQK